MGRGFVVCKGRSESESEASEFDIGWFAACKSVSFGMDGRFVVSICRFVSEAIRFDMGWFGDCKSGSLGMEGVFEVSISKPGSEARRFDMEWLGASVTRFG